MTVSKKSGTGSVSASTVTKPVAAKAPPAAKSKTARKSPVAAKSVATKTNPVAAKPKVTRKAPAAAKKNAPRTRAKRQDVSPMLVSRRVWPD